MILLSFLAQSFEMLDPLNVAYTPFWIRKSDNNL